MKLHLILAGLVLAAAPAVAFAADPVEGEWYTPGGAARVNIAPCPADPKRMCGTIIGLKHPKGDGKPARDTENDDPALRNRPLIGMMLLRDLRQTAVGHWSAGKIYDPRSGKEYASKIVAKPDGHLKVEGCITIACQEQTWQRN
jgi:uncharacterized protein (DUF2147 family)